MKELMLMPIRFMVNVSCCFVMWLFFPFALAFFFTVVQPEIGREFFKYWLWDK